jgi:hypothetical protein
VIQEEKTRSSVRRERLRAIAARSKPLSDGGSR